jgi:hypothetical protein
MIYLANATGETDGSMHSMLLNVGSRLPIVLVSRPNEFKFNEQLLSLTDYVLVDCCEYGHDVEITDTHFFGKNTDEKFFGGEEWKKFDEWVANHPPRLYLKRELLLKDVSDTVKPIEYAAWFPPPEVQSEEEFNKRPLEVMFSWGYSSEYRRQLHGKIWTDAHKYGYMVCDNLFYIQKFLEQEENPKKWLSVNISHYVRHPMPDILNIQGLSKVSISMPGAGRKCFRHSESPLNSVMAMANEGFAWSFDWADGYNCIMFDIGDEIKLINRWLENRPKDLYEIYRNGVDNVRRYYLPNYANHLEKLINNA